jgi:hypothetical protein
MTAIDLQSLSYVTGGLRTLPLAKRAAINLSAHENRVSPNGLTVDRSTLLGVENGRRSYGLTLNNRDNFIVELKRGGNHVRSIQGWVTYHRHFVTGP